MEPLRSVSIQFEKRHAAFISEHSMRNASLRTSPPKLGSPACPVSNPWIEKDSTVRLGILELWRFTPFGLYLCVTPATAMKTLRNSSFVIVAFFFTSGRGRSRARVFVVYQMAECDWKCDCVVQILPESPERSSNLAPCKIPQMSRELWQ